MKGYIGVTDNDWFDFLSQQPGIDEVNFWLDPEDYRIEIEIIDARNNLVGREILWSSLIDYQDDAKEISARTISGRAYSDAARFCSSHAVCR